MLEEAVATSSIWAFMNSWFTPTVLFVLLNVMIATIAITSSLANQKQQQHQARDQPHAEPAQGNYPQQPPRLARSPSVLQRLRSISLYSYTRSPEPNPSHSIANHFKQIPDPDILFDSEHTHHVQDREIQTHFDFQHIHQEQEPEQILETSAQTQYIFEQNIDENALKSDTQFDLLNTHEPDSMAIEADDDSEATHEAEEQEKEEESEEEDGLDEIYGQLPDRHVTRTKSDTKPASGELPAELPAKMRKSASLKSAFSHFEEEGIVEARRPATVRERKLKAMEGDEEVDARADDFINKFKQQLKLQRLDSIIRYKEMVGRGSGK